ncbi:unnamed protein product [Vitrella brassicaformis CCMP3155]|uniref:Zeta toxin domain-containing protein n=2 Tax=Vitrella brassicaformis TaxID=1169539 RepID=A0A0G4FEC2_VITBC|nr:unnamed protein product [Vitrella brassicaformis CCMP3155]|mmetsp:Transcript_10466/g.25318  ORF Transcript_10466/g.25318 Transcript_10466/m.25318 type:complete len:232 (-) Transcript_10466:125-820(-)|eukprot:CEM11306.1 unnamed protein product [Vitrella brassicaformis CCMP3155]
MELREVRGSPTSRSSRALPLVIFRGLPGTGKTHLALAFIKAMRKRDGLVFARVSRDELRRSLFCRPAYTEDEKQLCNGLVAVQSQHLVEHGWPVVVDGMALSHMEDVYALVNTILHTDAAAPSVGSECSSAARQEAGVYVLLVECYCSDGTATRRIEADGAMHPAGDRDKDLYFRVKERFEHSDDFVGRMGGGRRDAGVVYDRVVLCSEDDNAQTNVELLCERARAATKAR